MRETRLEGVEWRAVAAILRRRVMLAGICFAAVFGAAVAVSLLGNEEYSTSATILFRDPQFDQALSELYEARLVPATPDVPSEAIIHVDFVPLELVTQRTAEEVGVTDDEVEEKIEVTRDVAPDVSEARHLNGELAISLVITATDSDPEFAALLANTFAREYHQSLQQANRQVAVPSIGPPIRIAQAQRLVQNQLAQLKVADASRREVSALESTLEQLTVLASLRTGKPEAVRRADTPVSPASPDLTVNAALGAVLALLLALGLAVLVERLGGGLGNTAGPPEA